MVLQQGQQNKVWGKASPGEIVTVRIDDQSHEATVDNKRHWSVMLEPLPVGGPYKLTVSSTNEITIEDVLVGEVWICSGQSNMEWSVDNTFDADLVKASANYPEIRMIKFPRLGSQEPVWTHESATWDVCSPQTVGTFSAVNFTKRSTFQLA